MKQPPHERIRVPVDQAGTHLAVSLYEGSGPAMILIHGITSDSAEFDGVIPRLVDTCRPITIDLRGHGESDKPCSGYHYRDYVSDLSTVIAALGLERPLVLGHSLGGIVTLNWAASNPGIARGLIIEDSPLRSGEGFRKAFDGWLMLNAMPKEVLRAWYAEQHPTWNEALIISRSNAMHACARPAITELMNASMANQGIDTSDTLGRIAEPVLFLHGDPHTGSMVHPDDIVSLPDRITNVSVHRVEGAGHSLHRSHPDEWLTLVRDFMNANGD
jgi:pimeloyl-ACP methyl ester carboxylesterase